MPRHGRMVALWALAEEGPGAGGAGWRAEGGRVGGAMTDRKVCLK